MPPVCAGITHSRTLLSALPVTIWHLHHAPACLQQRVAGAGFNLPPAVPPGEPPQTCCMCVHNIGAITSATRPPNHGLLCSISAGDRVQCSSSQHGGS
jgi:hypothetical protein